MSTAARQPIVLPDTLQSVLEIRNRAGLVCPKDVEDRMLRLSFFKGKASGGASTNNRFTNLNRAAPDGWRTNKISGPEPSRFQTLAPRSHPTDTEEGFEVWSSRKKHTFARHAPAPAPAPAPSVATVGTVNPAPAIQDSNAWKSSRSKALEDKIANESTEDRIMGKVRSKINKIGESTYVPTKAFMQQILDSGNTDFLGEFMEFVFQKAATEPSFCGIYARLLHELADEFSHLRTEMQLRFREYTSIFVETEKTPDVGTADYKKFVESQEKKKFRRGYSQFVAELAKLGEVNFDDFRSLIVSIVASILQVYTTAENTLLCEEYVDCLSRMCHAGASMLKKESWANEQIALLSDIISSPRSSSPGLSNKARFALMDLQEFVERGWK
jgi:hypothetical protein